MKPSENKTIEPETLAWDDLALILSEDINDIKDNSSQEGLQIQIEN